MKNQIQESVADALQKGDDALLDAADEANNALLKKTPIHDLNNWMDKEHHASDDEHYKFEGADGFEEHGIPTMEKTAGVLTIIISGGTLATWSGTAAMSTSGSIWNGVGIGVNVYNTFGPANGASQAIGAGMDVSDVLKSGNPVAGMSLAYWLYQQSKKKK